MSATDGFPEYLYAGLAAKYGISISASNVPLARARLYKARAELQDPDLARLQFRPDPARPATHIWIIKGEEKNEPIEE